MILPWIKNGILIWQIFFVNVFLCLATSYSMMSLHLFLTGICTSNMIHCQDNPDKNKINVCSDEPIADTWIESFDILAMMCTSTGWTALGATLQCWCCHTDVIILIYWYENVMRSDNNDMSKLCKACYSVFFVLSRRKRKRSKKLDLFTGICWGTVLKGRGVIRHFLFSFLGIANCDAPWMLSISRGRGESTKVLESSLSRETSLGG